jgi:membrane fusion protein (multidrug efflux system)
MLLVACGGGEMGGEEQGAPPEPVSVVEVTEVVLGSVGDTLTASAVVESEASASLMPEASGVVKSLHADEGDPVTKGQLLAVLENVSLNTGAAKASAEVQRLRAQAERTRELFAQGAVSARDLEDAEHQLRTAQLTLREASAGYGTTRIVAPFDGVVARRDLRVGELATSATAAFQVVDLDRLRVVASLPERELGRVRAGQPVRLVSAYDSEVATEGVVERVAPVVDAASGTFRVTVSVRPGQTALRPGQFVSVVVEVGRHDDVMVVPKKAVVYEDGVPVVYTVVPESEEEEAEGEEGEEVEVAEGGGGGSWWPFGGGEASAGDDEGDEAADEEDDEPALVAERHVVELGLVDDRFGEIERGVELGDQVVTVGQSHLRDGAKVRPTTREAADAGAAEAAEESG